jgi:hypothetical protein
VINSNLPFLFIKYLKENIDFTYLANDWNHKYKMLYAHKVSNIILLF